MGEYDLEDKDWEKGLSRPPEATISQYTTTESSQSNAGVKAAFIACSTDSNQEGSYRFGTSQPVVARQEEAMEGPGRPEEKITSCLALMRTKAGNKAKVEYLRASFIRGIKKCIRLLIDGKGPPANLAVPEDELQMRIWHTMYQLVLQSPDLFELMGDTTNGTMMDGKTIRLREHLSESKYPSFSKAFCKDFYAAEPIRQFHFYYISLVFGVEIDPESVCKKLNLTCGEEPWEQVENWTRVKEYFTFEMFWKLGLDPYFEEISRNEPFMMEETVNPEEIPRNDDLTMVGLINTDFFLA